MKTKEASEPSSSVWIQNSRGERLQVEMTNEGGELLGTLRIDEVPYHVFYATRTEIGSGGEKIIVDRDPSYQPKLPKSGRCLLIAPYSE